ncbi:hypothetical protein Hanom_Chr07g00607181 [Helianthus anomalus]
MFHYVICNHRLSFLHSHILIYRSGHKENDKHKTTNPIDHRWIKLQNSLRQQFYIS